MPKQPTPSQDPPAAPGPVARLYRVHQETVEQRQRLIQEINELKAILDAPGPPPFDERAAEARIGRAEDEDIRSGRVLKAPAMRAVVRQEREAAQAAIEERERSKAEPRRAYTEKAAVLDQIEIRLSETLALLGDAERAAAKAQLPVAQAAYRAAVSEMLDSLLRVAALTKLSSGFEYDITASIPQMDSLPVFGSGHPGMSAGNFHVWSRLDLNPHVSRHMGAFLNSLRGTNDG